MSQGFNILDVLFAENEGARTSPVAASNAKEGWKSYYSPTWCVNRYKGVLEGWCWSTVECASYEIVRDKTIIWTLSDCESRTLGVIKSMMHLLHYTRGWERQERRQGRQRLQSKAVCVMLLRGKFIYQLRFEL